MKTGKSNLGMGGTRRVSSFSTLSGIYTKGPVPQIWAGAGSSYLAVTPGKLYPCHQFAGKTVFCGDVSELKQMRFCNVSKLYGKDACRDCFALLLRRRMPCCGLVSKRLKSL